MLTARSDNTVQYFVLPADILDHNGDVRQLQPQGATKLPEPSQAIVSAPFFSLIEPASQTFLVGCRDHPLQLYPAFPDSPSPTPIGSYKLVRQETEQYISPSSIAWPSPGTHFICGSANRLDYFDVSRHGSDGPVLTVPTIPSKRHISKGHGVGMKGTVSALAVSPADANGGATVAAGTWTRWMGLYDLHRADGVVANWKISPSDLPDSQGSYDGHGIVQVLWSPCGRYLVINERHSSGLLVYDIRGSGRLLAVLTGRQGLTQQKLNCDLFQGDLYGSGGFEVWAGSQDGTILVWDEVGLTAGETKSSWDFKAHDAPVGSTILHSSGSVAATCSGGWEHAAIEEPDLHVGTQIKDPPAYNVLTESSLKIWSIGQVDENQEQSSD